MPVLRFRGQIFPDTIHNAVPPVAKWTRSPRAVPTKRRYRCCSEAGQRNELPPCPIPKSGILPRRLHVNLRLEFGSDELSSIKFSVQSLRDASSHQLRK